ncbi:hypothetical protein PCE1_000292 [Barthelona sp. PCE]
MPYEESDSDEDFYDPPPLSAMTETTMPAHFVNSGKLEKASLRATTSVMQTGASVGRNVRIEELQEEVAELKNRLFAVTNADNLPRGSIEQQIARLVRENRSLRQNLEKERLEKHKYMTELNTTSRAPVTASTNRSTRRKQITDESTLDERYENVKRDLHDRKKQLDALVDKMGAVTLENTTLKRESNRLVMLLKREVGEEQAVELMSNPNHDSQWTGRAQKIQLLKEKLKRMSGNPQTSRGHRTVQKVQSARSSTMRDLENELSETTEQLAKATQRARARKARIDVLEKDLSKVRADIQLLLKKSQNDSMLIQKLQEMNPNESEMHVATLLTKIQDMEEEKAELQIAARTTVGNASHDPSYEALMAEMSALHRVIGQQNATLYAYEVAGVPSTSNILGEWQNRFAELQAGFDEQRARIALVSQSSNSGSGSNDHSYKEEYEDLLDEYNHLLMQAEMAGVRLG